jgi:hypothetical protein
MVETPVKVRVVDATTARTLGETVARTGSFVSIDERNGVRVGEVSLLAGPLSREDVYEIYATPIDEANQYRTELTAPSRGRK